MFACGRRQMKSSCKQLSTNCHFVERICQTNFDSLILMVFNWTLTGVDLQGVPHVWVQPHGHTVPCLGCIDQIVILLNMEGIFVNLKIGPHGK